MKNRGCLNVRFLRNKICYCYSCYFCYIAMSARRLTKPSSICSWRVIRKKRLRRLLAYHRKQQATELQTLAILATLQNPLKLSPITKIQTFKYRFTTSGLNRRFVAIWQSCKNATKSHKLRI